MVSMAVIIGIFWYIMGYTWIPTVSFIVLGLISDFVMKAGKYKKVHEYSWIQFFLQYAGASLPMWLLIELIWQVFEKLWVRNIME